VLAAAVLEQLKRYLTKLPATDRSRLLVLGTVNHQTKIDLLDVSSLLDTSIFTRIHRRCRSVYAGSSAVPRLARLEGRHF
jgi:uncharacterized membrane protein